MKKLYESGLSGEKAEVKRTDVYDVTVFGEILIDFTKDGVNGQGQTLFAQIPGGAPANVAVAASRLGARTACLGKVGDDMHGELLCKTLEENQVETGGIIRDSNVFTTLAFVDIDKSGERKFSFARKPGADTQMRKDELDTDILDRTKIFHVGSLSLTDEPSRSTTLYAVKRAKKNGSIISYDPNYRESLWKSRAEAVERMRSLISYADIMKLSDEEIGLLTDCDDVEEAARTLIARGVKIVAVTLGSRGTFVCCKKGGAYVPAFASAVVDTNGAGDSFQGGFLYRTAKSEKPFEELGLEDLKDFAKFGNAVAGLCVEKKGAIPAMPTPDEVKRRLES